MAGFHAFINCDTDVVAEINILDVLPHPLSPFRILSPNKIFQLNEQYPTGGKIELTVRPVAASSLYPFEHYEALCDYNIIEKKKLEGYLTCECRILNSASDNDAIVLMLKNTLHSNQQILPSERSLAYSLLQEHSPLEALAISGECKESFDKIIELTNLIPEFITFLDSKKMSIQTGSMISALDNCTQKVIYNYLLRTRKKLSFTKAYLIRRYSEDIGAITENILSDIFTDTFSKL